MKKKMLFLITFLVHIIICAQTFADNNITYKVISANTVEITGYDNTGGTNVTIPATVANALTTYNVTSIGALAFFNKGLTSVIIPNSVTNISNVAFRVNQLTNVTIPNSVNNIGVGAFVSNPLLTSVTFGSSLNTIGSSSFGGCALTHIDIPDSVTTIGNAAFGNNQLESITLGTNVSTIGTSAFTGNTSTLNTVISKAITPPTITTGGTTDTFNPGGDRSGIDLIVPGGTSATYNGSNWTDFASVTEIMSQSTETFETETTGSTSFTNNSQSFTIENGAGETTYDIENFTNGGWNGSSSDNKFIDNSSGSPALNDGTSFSIKTTDGKDINIKSFYLFVSKRNLTTGVSTTITITGKKNGVVTPIFTITKSSGIVDGANFTPNNGFTFIDFSLEGGANNSNTPVDEIVISSTGNADYLALDAFTWDIANTEPTVITTAASSVSNTSVTLAGNITANGGETVVERGIVYSKTSENANPLIGGANVIKNTNGAGAGIFSESITNLSAGTPYSFKAYGINSIGTSYGTTATFTTTGKGWTGNINTDWNTGGNWSGNTVPIATDNVFIPDVFNKPIISNNTNATANDITIDANSSLTISNGGSIIIEGTPIVNGEFTYTLNINDDKWHLVSSPVSGEQFGDTWNATNNIDTNLPNEAVAKYINTSDANGDWIYFQDGSINENFSSGNGYSLKRTGAGTYTFTGTFPSYPISSVITASNIGLASENRWTLVGNPFPSYINIDAFLTANSTPLTDSHEAVYVWNANANEYQLLTSGKIHPGQGFFVNANVASTSVNFTKAMQSSENGITFFRNSNPEIIVKAFDGEKEKTTEINYLEGKTTGLDSRFDVGTFTGKSSGFNIYSHLVSDSEGVNFAKQALPNSNFENIVIPIGIKSEADKEITFSVNSSNFLEGLNIFLEDRATKTFTRLDKENSSYKVLLSKALNGIGRFYLHTSSKVLSTELINLNNISMHVINNTTLRIAGLSNIDANVIVYNLLGKQLLETSFHADSLKDIDLAKLSAGVYLVKLTTNRGKLNKKIILK